MASTCHSSSCRADGSERQGWLFPHRRSKPSAGFDVWAPGLISGLFPGSPPARARTGGGDLHPSRHSPAGHYALNASVARCCALASAPHRSRQSRLHPPRCPHRRNVGAWARGCSACCSDAGSCPPEGACLRPHRLPDGPLSGANHPDARRLHDVPAARPRQKQAQGHGDAAVDDEEVGGRYPPAPRLALATARRWRSCGGAEW